MTRRKLLMRVWILGFMLNLFFLVGQAMAIEEAKYKILEKQDDFELRRYEPTIVAETIVEGDFDQVGNEAFRRLFSYISGNNRKKESIRMTAPVSQEGGSEKIAMAAPVNQEGVGGKWRITFLMPSKYTMETLPVPLDSRVELKEVPGPFMASLRYSGTWSRKRYERKVAQLLELIKARGLDLLANRFLVDIIRHLCLGFCGEMKYCFR